MSKSSIEWTQETWNPIVGCSIKSPGCAHCYAMPMAARIEAINAALVADGKPPQSPQYDGTTKTVNGHAVWTGKLALAEKTLLQPLKRKKPTMYFVNSMGDLFHEDCPDEDIDQVFAIMALSPHHTYQVLTKRAARMRVYCSDPDTPRRVAAVIYAMGAENGQLKYEDQEKPGDTLTLRVWPLPNVWLGVSTERQQEADERIPELLRTLAAVRFISYEPALSALNIEPWLPWPEDALDVNDKSWGCQECDGDRGCDCPNEKAVYTITEGPFDPTSLAPKWIHERRETLDWVICGGESGPDARAMHPDWVRSLRDQCDAANVRFFFKQWGNWKPDDHIGSAVSGSMVAWPDGAVGRGDAGDHGGMGTFMFNVGKGRAGKLLDGVEHQGMPAIHAGDHLLQPAKAASK